MGTSGGDADFVAAFDELLLRRGGTRERRSIWGFVDSYEDLIVQCEQGYAWTIYDYENEVSVRDVLGDALRDEQLVAYDQLDAIRERVAQLDQRMRGVLRDDVAVGSSDWPWWRRGVLRSAGTDYANDIRRIYGLDVAAAP